MRNLKTLSMPQHPSNMHHMKHLELFITYTYPQPFNNDLHIAEIYHLQSCILSM